MMDNKKNTHTKTLVLFSGGLDSRLAIKLLQEQGLDVEAVFIQLPFGKRKIPEFKKIKLHVIDCTIGDLFHRYIELIKSPKHGTGTAMNPCKDCKIFLFEQAKELAKKIKAKIIATGEVLGQRPMSQLKPALLFDEKQAGLENKILRPLSAKLLPETEYEKKGIVDRKKLLDIKGRNRKKQMQLAKKYKIKYPFPGGGCLLCEKDYVVKLKDLFKHKKQKQILKEEIAILQGFRHFRDKSKIILGKDKTENDKLELINKTLKWNMIIPDKIPGPTAIFEDKQDEKLAKQLIKAYSSNDLDKRHEFEGYKV